MTDEEVAALIAELRAARWAYDKVDRPLLVKAANAVAAAQIEIADLRGSRDWAKGKLLQFLWPCEGTLEGLVAQVIDRAKQAESAIAGATPRLALIAECAGKTLISCNPDEMWQRGYSEGAHNAFNQCAANAAVVLALLKRERGPGANLA